MMGNDQQYHEEVVTRENAATVTRKRFGPNSALAIEGGVARLLIDRPPPLNLLSRALAIDLQAVLSILQPARSSVF